MSGGLGADRFRFTKPNETGLGANADVITDFRHGTDHIDLASLTGRLDFVGSDDFIGGSTGSVGFVRVNRDLMVRIDGDGDGLEDATIVLLQATRLSTDDFLV